MAISISHFLIKKQCLIYLTTRDAKTLQNSFGEWFLQANEEGLVEKNKILSLRFFND